MTDYNRDRPTMAQFYQNDPIAYWANFGIPPLARLARMKADLGADSASAFEGLMQAFNEPKLLAAVEMAKLPPAFLSDLKTQLSAGLSTSNALISAITNLIVKTDAAGTNNPNVGPILVPVFTNAFDLPKLAPLAPQPTKPIGTNTPHTNTLDWIELHYSDNFTQRTNTFRFPVRPPSDDTNTTTHTPWDKITTPTAWNTTLDAACAAVAVGASLAKLGVFPPDTTCQFWNDLARLLGAKPGQQGAYESDIAALYNSLGYSCTEAYDGTFESAVEEAKKALDRGCDVALTYISADGKHGHVEMVTGITVDPANSAQATVSTLSWGSGATVTVSAGSYSGKSDGQQYRAPGETSSFLEGKGTAILKYYCKQ